MNAVDALRYGPPATQRSPGEWCLRGLIALALLAAGLALAGAAAVVSAIEFSGCFLSCSEADKQPLSGAVAAGAALLFLGAGIYGVVAAFRRPRPHPANARALALLVAGIAGGYAVFHAVATAAVAYAQRGCTPGPDDYGYAYCSPPSSAMGIAGALGLAVVLVAIRAALRTRVGCRSADAAQPSSEASVNPRA